MKNKSIFEDKFLHYIDGKYTNIWEAIKKATEHMLALGFISKDWIKRLKTLTDAYGYYFILTDDMALPHISPCIDTIKDTLGLAIFEKPIDIDVKNHPKKSIRYILTLVSTSSDGHMKSLKKIVDLWNEPEWLTLLENVKSNEDIIKIKEFLEKKEENKND